MVISLAASQLPLVDNEYATRLATEDGVGVVPARAAVSWPCARQSGDLRDSWRSEVGDAGHLNGIVPGAVDLAGQESVCVVVVPGDRAVAGPGARQRSDLSTVVVRRRAGDSDVVAPPTINLADHESLELVRAVEIPAASGAIARCGARHGLDPAAIDKGELAGYHDGLAPGAVHLVDDERPVQALRGPATAGPAAGAAVAW